VVFQDGVADILERAHEHAARTPEAIEGAIHGRGEVGAITFEEALLKLYHEAAISLEAALANANAAAAPNLEAKINFG
jgi:Tfp pilus assembly ATPase PilU